MRFTNELISDLIRIDNHKDTPKWFSIDLIQKEEEEERKEEKLSRDMRKPGEGRVT